MTVPNCKKCRLFIGQFWRDSNPIIGRVLEFALWNRTLSRDEMEKFSDCNSHVAPKGDFIQDFSRMEVKGTLIQEITEELPEVQCREEKQKFLLFVP